MTDRWYCPYCLQSSTRNWNLKTHINRKHNGAGNPIRKTGFTYDPSLSGTNHAYLSRRNYSTSPYPMFKNKMHESDKTNPFADTQQFVRNWSDLLTDLGKLNSQIALHSSNPLAFSAFPSPNLLSFMPGLQMSLRGTFGFKAQSCYACLALSLVPVFYPDEGHNLPHFTHSCNPFNSQPKIINNLEDYSALLLKDVAIETGFINLIAIPLAEPHQEFLMLMNPHNPKKPLVLTYTNESNRTRH
jgi:hypothetical protein